MQIENSIEDSSEDLSEDSSEARVFFALWPEARIKRALHTLALEYQSRCKGRAMRADTMHMTLLFLGGVERIRLPQLMQAAGKISVPAFGFTLEKLSFWLHNRIAYAAPLAEVPTLSQLVMALQQELIATGFLSETHDFNPHVTLLRHVGHALESQTIAPMVWKADSFVLVESVMTDRGTHYQILRKWPLHQLKVNNNLLLNDE